jgi:hypothetical protein
MAGPFPGMDPYLEHPAQWPGWHQGFVTFLWTKLNALLPPRYIANLNERIYVVGPERDIYPDVTVRERAVATPPSDGADAAEAMPGDAPVILALEPEEIHESFIEIVPVADQGRVIAVVELLSPSNKAAGSPGRRQYRAKQREVLAGPTHLIEIDLHRQGRHTVVAPRERLLRRVPFDYLVSLSRGGRRDRCEAWPFTLRQRMPRVAVPLLDDDPDLILDLQAVFERCYDEGAYARRLDYRRDPVPPLSRADAEWADALLHERGLRT